MSPRLLALLLLLVLGCPPWLPIAHAQTCPPTHPATFHVSNAGGNNANSCCAAQSATTPKASITDNPTGPGGLTCMGGGDTLVIHAGLYAERLLDVVPAGLSSTQQTVVKANGNAFLGTGEQVELRPPNHPDQPIVRVGGPYVVLDGFIVDARNQAVNGYPYLVEIGQNITMRNMEVRNLVDTCDVRGFGGAGITDGHGDLFNTYQYVHVHHISTYGGKKSPAQCATETAPTPRDSIQTIHGLYIDGGSDVVEFSNIHDNAGWGIHQYANDNPPTFVPDINNQVFRNNILANNFNTGIQLSGGGNNQAYNNIIIGGDRGFVIGKYGNHAAHDSKVYHNTLYNTTSNCILTNSTGALIRNNICATNSGKDTFILDQGGGYTQSNNCLGSGSSCTQTNPANLFVVAAPGTTATDYQLKALPNPAINTGSTLPGITTDYATANRDAQPDIGAYEFGASILVSNPTLWWKLDTGSGTTAFDATANANNGTLSGSPLPTWIGGRVGPASLQFNGSSNYVTKTDLAWAANQPITVAFWINTPGGVEAGAFGIDTQATPNRVGAHVPWSDNILYWDYGTCCGAGTNRLSTDFSAYLNRWVYVVLVSDPAGSQAIYLNGAVVTSKAGGAPTSPLTGLDVGRWQVSPPVYATASIDDFRLENRAWSASEILTAYRQSARIRGHRGMGLR